MDRARPPETPDPDLEERISRLEMIVVEAGTAAGQVSSLATEIRRELRTIDELASALAMALSHLEDALRRFD